MSDFLSITSVLNTIKSALGLSRPDYSMPKKQKIKKEIMPELSIEEERQLVSELIFKTLSRTFCVRESLRQFPADQFDPSIQAAWHALTHFEADEDIRLRDPEFAREQDEYLEMIAFTLQKGDALPLNIINCYKPYHQMALIPRSNKFKSLIKSLLRYTI